MKPRQAPPESLRGKKESSSLDGKRHKQQQTSPRRQAPTPDSNVSDEVISTKRINEELRGQMVASICDVGTSSMRDDSRRMTREGSKTAPQSLSRAIASRHRSKSRCARGKRGDIESRTHTMPPPPPRKTIEDKIYVSLDSDHSNQTDSTHPSTTFNCSGSDRDRSFSPVPHRGKQEKTFPLPPSREPQRLDARRASYGSNHLNRSYRESIFDEEIALDLSTRSESRLTERVPSRRSISRSKSQSRFCEDVYELPFNDLHTSTRPSRDMNRINFQEVQRSLSRNTRRKRTESEYKNVRSESKDEQKTTASITQRERRASMSSTKSKSAREHFCRDISSKPVPINKSFGRANKTTNVVKDSESSSHHERDYKRPLDHPKSSLTKPLKKSQETAPFVRRSRSHSRPRPRSTCEQEDSQHDSSEKSDLLSNPISKGNEEAPVINLVIDDITGFGSFFVPVNYANALGSSEKHQQLFTVQLNEPSREFFIQTSMGLLHKIREIHPNTNILRTLTYWNGLQKRRYHHRNGHPRSGGQLGISKADSQNINEVIMTLVGKYHNRDWEYDEEFHDALEAFAEDALRYYACLNDESEVKETNKKKKGMRIGGSTASHMSGSKVSTSGSPEDSMGKKVLCKVLEKITG